MLAIPKTNNMTNIHILIYVAKSNININIYNKHINDNHWIVGMTINPHASYYKCIIFDSNTPFNEICIMKHLKNSIFASYLISTLLSFNNMDMCSYALVVIAYETFGKIQSFLPSCPLTYIYPNFMQQYDTHSCELFVIAYAIDIIFNIQLKSLK
jgi:hypothetical protein